MAKRSSDRLRAVMEGVGGLVDIMPDVESKNVDSKLDFLRSKAEVQKSLNECEAFRTSGWTSLVDDAAAIKRDRVAFGKDFIVALKELIREGGPVAQQLEESYLEARVCNRKLQKRSTSRRGSKWVFRPKTKFATCDFAISHVVNKDELKVKFRCLREESRDKPAVRASGSKVAGD